MRKLDLVMVCILLMSILSGSSYAIGITPSSVSFNYEPGLHKDIEFRLIPSSDRDAGANIGIQDSEISEYLKLSKTHIEFTGNSEDNKFVLTVDIPDNKKNLVGLKSPRIVVSGISNTPNAMLRATAGVKVPIRIYFPYPGKYVDINSFGVSNVNEGEDTTASWTLQSRGKEIVSVNQKVQFFNSDNMSFFEKSLDSVILQPNQIYTEKLIVPVKDKVSGEYHAILMINFDNQEKNRADRFIIGTRDVELTNYKPKNLDYDAITEMEFVFENKWNGLFKDVYGVIKIFGRDSQTATTMLEPLRGVAIRNYVDTKGVKPGNYTGIFSLHFDDNEKSFPFNVTVLTKEDTQKKNGTYEEPTDYTFVITLVIILLIISGIVIYLWVIRNKKE